MGAAESGSIIATRPDAFSTERVILLPLDRGDLLPVYAMTTDPALMEGVHITPHQSEEEAEAFIAAETQAPNLAYKLILRGTAQFAGMLSLKPDPDQPEKVLISVVLMENCWNQGYLTELLPMADRLAKEKLTAKSLWAYIPDSSLYALRAFFKAGYMVSSVLSLPEQSFQVCSKNLEETV
jgi:RimJ/RimL family protein N-acetyltransferase